MRKKFAVLLVILSVFLLAFVSQSFSDDKSVMEQEAVEKKAAAEKKAADLRAAEERREADLKEGYVGSETCKGCHPTQYKTYKDSVHSKEMVKGPGSKEACETCHGAGAKHVEKGGGRGVEIFTFVGKKADVKAKTAKCLACHQENKNQVFWEMSKHATQGVSCDNCHNPHGGNDKLLRTAQPDLCFGCHKDIKILANKQSHHPIKEGKVLCKDCHDPHGEFGQKMLKADTVNELCYKCHAEKRGPFLWEHAPVSENCLACHNPHGSNHSRLLTLRPAVLCKDCHEISGHGDGPYNNTASFANTTPGNQIPKPTATSPTLNPNQTYNIGNMLKFDLRACVNCHVQIHGSNGPGAYGQRFIR